MSNESFGILIITFIISLFSVGAGCIIISFFKDKEPVYIKLTSQKKHYYNSQSSFEDEQLLEKLSSEEYDVVINDD